MYVCTVLTYYRLCTRYTYLLLYVHNSCIHTSFTLSSNTFTLSSPLHSHYSHTLLSTTFTLLSHSPLHYIHSSHTPLHYIHTSLTLSSPLHSLLSHSLPLHSLLSHSLPLHSLLLHSPSTIFTALTLSLHLQAKLHQQLLYIEHTLKVHGIVDVPKPVKCLEGPKSPRNPSRKSLEMQLMAEVASHSKQQSKVNPRVLHTTHCMTCT